MSMSDCFNCLNTPCTCGYEYSYWSKQERINQAAVILGVTPEELEKVAGEIIPNEHPMKGKVVD